MSLHFRLLEGERAEMQKLQKLIDSCDEYYNQITGYPPGLAESETLYSSLPEGKSYEDKLLYGLFDGEQLIACADVIRAYPNAEVAEVGIVLVHPRKRRQGFGRTLLREIESTAAEWPGIKCLRSELPTFLEGSVEFAMALGFAPTGEKRPYTYQHVHGEQIALQKLLKP